MTITITDIISILRKVADISLVWLVFYLILKIYNLSPNDENIILKNHGHQQIQIYSNIFK